MRSKTGSGGVSRIAARAERGSRSSSTEDRSAQRGVGSAGRRQPEQVALQEVAAEQAERPALLLGLHPLRDDGEAELGMRG